MQELIKADNLCKSRSDEWSLQRVSITVHEAECVGIFGLSGSGKSTLLTLLAGIERPDSGTVSTGRPRAGISLQSPDIQGRLSLAEYLWLYATLYEIPRPKRHAAIREAVSLLGLELLRARRISSLSRGEHKRVELAQALMSPFDLLLLDEPMADLDFRRRRLLWEHLCKIRIRDGKGIVVATARTEDAELCDRIMLLHNGRVLASGTPDELRRMVEPQAFAVRYAKPADPAQSQRLGVVEQEEEGTFIIEVNPESGPTDLLRQVPGRISAIRLRSPGLDQVLEELIAAEEAG